MPFTLMNRNENFKDFLSQRYPELNVDTTIEAFQWWLCSGGDYRRLDLDDYEEAEGEAERVREELTKEIDGLEARIDAMENKE